MAGGYYEWRPYVSVGERRKEGEKKIAELRRRGHPVRPVRPEEFKGRAMASSAWGRAWCDHLESYSDFANRLPRGRTYARNGSVIDLQIGAAKITSLVSGSEIYEIEIKVGPLARERWRALVKDTSGRIDSVVGLLRGKIDGGVMARMCDRDRGLFPAPREIQMSCSCPDWAGMCKHIAAALYGVGARLDSEPELLFTLRGVDHKDLIAEGATTLSREASEGPAADDDALGALFGIEIGGGEDEPKPKPASTKGKAATKKQALVNTPTVKAAPAVPAKVQTKPAVKVATKPAAKVQTKPAAKGKTTLAAKVATKPAAKVETKAAKKIEAPKAAAAVARKSKAATAARDPWVEAMKRAFGEGYQGRASAAAPSKPAPSGRKTRGA